MTVEYFTPNAENLNIPECAITRSPYNKDFLRVFYSKGICDFEDYSISMRFKKSEFSFPLIFETDASIIIGKEGFSLEAPDTEIESQLLNFNHLKSDFLYSIEMSEIMGFDEIEKNADDDLDNGNYEEAILFFGKALEEKPSDPLLIYNLALCYESKPESRKYEIEKAIKYYEKYLKLSPDAEDKNEVKDKIASLYQKTGKPSKDSILEKSSSDFLLSSAMTSKMDVFSKSKNPFYINSAAGMCNIDPVINAKICEELDSLINWIYRDKIGKEQKQIQGFSIDVSSSSMEFLVANVNDKLSKYNIDFCKSFCEYPKGLGDKNSTNCESGKLCLYAISSVHYKVSTFCSEDQAYDKVIRNCETSYELK